MKKSTSISQFFYAFVLFFYTTITISTLTLKFALQSPGTIVFPTHSIIALSNPNTITLPISGTKR